MQNIENNLSKNTLCIYHSYDQIATFSGGGGGILPLPPLPLKQDPTPT